jgi:hypothetical protein
MIPKSNAHLGEVAGGHGQAIISARRRRHVSAVVVVVGGIFCPICWSTFSFILFANATTPAGCCFNKKLVLTVAVAMTVAKAVGAAAEQQGGGGVRVDGSPHPADGGRRGGGRRLAVLVGDDRLQRGLRLDVEPSIFFFSFLLLRF